MADLDRGEWPELARTAAVVLTEAKQDDENDNDSTRLLADCRQAFAGRDVIATTDLLIALREDPEAPWATHGHHGLNGRTLAQMLKEFGISSQRIRTGGPQFRGAG